jgi:hypothetical protein
MKHSSLKFQISRLQQAKLNTNVEIISVIVLALFTSAILPNLLVRYYYINQQLMEEPALLEYIPVLAFVIGVGYGVFGIFLNILRSMKIKKLTKELEHEFSMLEMSDCCSSNCCGGCNPNQSESLDSKSSDSDWADMESFEELDKMVDEVIAKNEAQKSSVKSAKGSVKKSAKTKTSSKKKASSK